MRTKTLIKLSIHGLIFLTLLLCSSLSAYAGNHQSTSDWQLGGGHTIAVNPLTIPSQSLTTGGNACLLLI